MAIEKKAKQMRRDIAANMSKSWNIAPKCDYEMRINAEPMMAFRKEFNEINGCKISFLNMVMKAAAIALKEFPYVNSSYDEERKVFFLHEEANVGFAMAFGDGLVVPNVKKTEDLSLIEIGKETSRLIEMVNSGHITPDDFQYITGGTFTINNMGTYKRLIHHNAIINQPEMAILSMYNITEEPVVINGELSIKKCMVLMLSADHRGIDGKMACAFLDRVCEILEDPQQLL